MNNLDIYAGNINFKKKYKKMFDAYASVEKNTNRLFFKISNIFYIVDLNSYLYLCINTILKYF